MRFFFLLDFLTLPNLIIATVRAKSKIHLVTDPNEAPKKYIGTLRIKQFNSGKIRINGYLFNLRRGYHGIHFHPNPGLSNGCKGAGRKLIVQNTTLPEGEAKNDGDLGRIYANKRGLARVNIYRKFNYIVRIR